MANIVEIVKEWPTGRKVALLSALVVVIAAMVLLFAWVQRPDYKLLYTNLSDADSGIIIQKLKDMKVPYVVEAGGVMVPADRVYDLRLQLAAQGIPQGSGVGFEIFDKTDFQTTDFVQKLNYRRALEGELARTINSLQEVEKSRVHLAIPEKTVFMRDKERVSASVVLKLKSGRSLSRQQVQGIVHIVSSSVEGLKAGDITVVNDGGEMLTRQMDDKMGLTGSQMEYQREYEAGYEQMITDILEPVVGKGKVRAKVTAVLDFTQDERTEENYNPDGQVARSEQTVSEKSQSGSPGGVPGTTANLPGKTGATGGKTGQSQKQSETINYEISKTVSHVVKQYGELKKLTAAVLVDGIYAAGDVSKDAAKDAAKAGAAKATATAAKATPAAAELVYKPRSDDDIKRYEDLVKKAVGYTEKRGDEITVVNMQFEAGPKEEFAEVKRDIVKEALGVLKSISPLLVAVMFFLFFVRPLIKSFTKTSMRESAVELPVHRTAAQTEQAMKDELEELGTLRGVPAPPSDEMPLRKEVAEWAEWVKGNPAQASQMVKEWVEKEEA
jgi:flagellar M-ring protein FliF